MSAPAEIERLDDGQARPGDGRIAAGWGWDIREGSLSPHISKFSMEPGEILLAGGDKSSQANDIQAAQELSRQR